MKTKNKKNQKRQILYACIAGILVVVLIVCGVLFQDHTKQTSSGSDSDYHTISYNGKSYDYNSSIVSILLMGIDTTDEKTNGQADFMNLVLLDRNHKTMKIVSISRDTMTKIHLFDVQHNSLGWQRQHLALAYAYGNSAKDGAMLTSQAVSKLLYGVPIVHYAAMDLSNLQKVQDLVGDLQLVCPNDSVSDINPEWKKGNTITITRDNVESFVRKRDTEVDYSNQSRMERQRAYIHAYIQKVQEMLQENLDDTVSKLYNLNKNMTTNITLDDVQSFADMLLTYSYNEGADDYSLQGTNKHGADHDEFVVDKKALKHLVVELFYKKGN